MYNQYLVVAWVFSFKNTYFWVILVFKLIPKEEVQLNI